MKTALILTFLFITQMVNAQHQALRMKLTPNAMSYLIAQGDEPGIVYGEFSKSCDCYPDVALRSWSSKYFGLVTAKSNKYGNIYSIDMKFDIFPTEESYLRRLNIWLSKYGEDELDEYEAKRFKEKAITLRLSDGRVDVVRITGNLKLNASGRPIDSMLSAETGVQSQCYVNVWFLSVTDEESYLTGYE